MKKIIRPGTITEMVCKKCGCLFSYESEDIETINYEIIFSEPLNQSRFPIMKNTYVTCPQCKEKIILEATR